MVIAADEGIDNARQLGMPVDLLVGDLDSASDGSEAFAGSVQRHPVDKGPDRPRASPCRGSGGRDANRSRWWEQWPAGSTTLWETCCC
ncbi:MAG: hypothetical protein Ct9H300mP12_11740 [Acidimicrobiales bacterium]|nr:MAG: hypothetical protein Ct9H300mP12_11740 [Acidimicrobiales bacterium]